MTRCTRMTQLNKPCRNRVAAGKTDCGCHTTTAAPTPPHATAAIAAAEGDPMATNAHPQAAVLLDHPSLVDVTARFRDAGVPLYAVGGCVRDLLHSGSPGNDLDLCTPADTGTIKQLLDPLGSLSLDGEEFGTIRLCRKGHPDVEITRFRAEAYRGDSRKPDTVASSSLKDDLDRRDFTVNALAIDMADGSLLDFHGGQEDLEAGVLRAVGDPVERFSEDPLRVVRMVRFAAQRGWRTDPDTRDAAKQVVADGRLDIVSAERVVAEARKILSSRHPAAMSRSLKSAYSLGFLDRLFPGISVTAGMQTASGMDRSSDPRDRLAWMIFCSAPDAAGPGAALKRAKWPHAEVDAAVRVAHLAKVARATPPDVRDEPRIHGHPDSEPAVEARRLVRRHSDAELDAAARIARADGGGLHRSVGAARRNADAWRAPLPVDGHDAIQMGMQGPQIGRWLRAAEERFLHGHRDRESLLAVRA